MQHPDCELCEMPIRHPVRLPALPSKAYDAECIVTVLAQREYEALQIISEQEVIDLTPCVDTTLCEILNINAEASEVNLLRAIRDTTPFPLKLVRSSEDMSELAPCKSENVRTWSRRVRGADVFRWIFCGFEGVPIPPLYYWTTRARRILDTRGDDCELKRAVQSLH
jgi:hypothetical protein